MTLNSLTKATSADTQSGLEDSGFRVFNCFPPPRGSIEAVESA